MLVGGALVFLVPAPVRRTGFFAVRGHRVFGVPRAAVRSLDVVLDERRFSARRSGETWAVDGRPASAATADALDDLLATLVGLRAIDAFRTRDAGSYGLDRPRATITLATGHERRTLVLGEVNAAGSAFYARRDRDPRILEIGTLLLSEIERVFYTRDGPRQRPEIG